MIDEYQTYFVVPINSRLIYTVYYLPKPPWQKHEDDHYLDIQTDQCKESSCNCRGSRHYQRRHALTAVPFHYSMASNEGDDRDRD
jgi:hypothetical protein